MKIDRQRIFQKFNGHCAYCGIVLKIKDMHVDHIHPKNKAHFYKSEAMREEFHLTGRNVHSLDNLNPSCPSCNIYKGSLTLDQFRDYLQRQPEIQSRKPMVRLCKRFKIIEFNLQPIKFYFETAEIFNG